MESAPNAKAEDEGKKKRTWGSAFFTFLASGGIIVLLVVGVALAVVISVLIK